MGWMATLLLLAFAPPAAAGPAFQTVAAFDIGSGSTRMLVADVSLCGGQILAVRKSRKIRVPYASDLLHGDGRLFSEAIGQQASAAMADFSELAAEHGAERMVGVATQAFRQADNGQQLLDSWRQDFGLEIRIISQNEEARLAYRLVEARLGHSTDRLVVWDIGAGSQQMVWRDAPDGRWQYLNSDIASVSFRDRAIQQLQRPALSQSPNPINAEEARSLSGALSTLLDREDIAEVSAYLADGGHVVGIGGVHGASLVNQLGLQPGEEITRDGVQAALARQLGRTDQEIGGDYADTEVSNLILVGTQMDLYGIDRYQVMPMNLTEAVLLDLFEDCASSKIRPTTSSKKLPMQR